MPDRLSRLLKATLRRRSNPALPQDKKADSKAVDSNGPGGSSHHAHAHDDDNHQHHDVPTKSRAYSVVSSFPVDHPSSPDEIVAAPTTPATSYSTDHQGRPVVHRQYFEPVEPSPKEIVPAVRPDEVVARRDSEASVEQQQKQVKKSAERDGSLEPGPTTTTITANPTAPDDFDFSTSGAILQNPDPFGSLPLKVQQRPVVDPSLHPVAEFGNHPSATSSKRPSLVIRRQSLLPASHQHLVRNLLDPQLSQTGATATAATAAATAKATATATATDMQARKIWVRRPGGSPTLVPVLEDAVVDELRDQVIVKYTNSLGKTFDSPDITIRVVPREGLGKQPERLLNPEESLVAVVDTYYPGGQRVDEALLIDIFGRRTPKPSPRPVYYHNEAAEHDYFSIVPVNPSTPPTHTANSSSSANQATPSISILTTGKAPPLPSPGSTRSNRHARRPPAVRHTTGSPTVGQKGLSFASFASPSTDHIETVASPVQAQPPSAVPTTPIPPAPESPQAKALTPPPARGTSPRARPSLKDKNNSASPLFNSAFSGLNEGTVPPINVLIVEDNIINQKLLEAFMKRLSVRWKCAGNGEEAVKKWRQGGFHLVLMDIQLPVMNGLEATKEIRRLERLNGIGVFPKTPDGRASATNPFTISSENYGPSAPLPDEDTLHDRTLFKSPVIIVALTASSLQSDRHEALAAGCNDFLTKVGCPPVPPCPLLSTQLTVNKARRIPLASTKSHRMGLHASSNRLRRLATLAWLRQPA